MVRNIDFIKKNLIIFTLIIFCVTSCKLYTQKNTSELAEIAGCWQGGQVLVSGIQYSEVRLFSWKPDSSLALSMIYEIGSRSRVWRFDIDVTVREEKILWAYHEGSLSKNKDTMTILKDYRGEKSLWRFVRDRSADSLMVQLYAYREEAYVYRVPENLDDGWQCSDLDTSGINKAKIVALFEEIRKGDHDDIHSLLIVKNNKLVVEEYFALNGEKDGPFITRLFRDKVHHLASTTKGITSALVGIAIDRDFIRNVNEPIHLYLPAYGSLFSEEKKRIKISDMLTMRAGFEWRQFGVSDASNDGMQMWGTEDVIRYVLQKPMEAEPGKKFNYSNGVPTVMGAILKKAVGMEMKRFAEKYFFHPLGISEYLWTSYHDGSIETDGGLALRSRDLAKIGQLFLEKGVWHGKRIVSEEWIRESTMERLKFGRSSRWGYGYYWMQTAWKIGDRLISCYFVPGDGNQILAVFPGLDMVVVFTAGNYGVDPKAVYYSLFEKFILPAVIPE